MQDCAFCHRNRLLGCYRLDRLPHTPERELDFQHGYTIQLSLTLFAPGVSQATRLPIDTSSSRSQQMVVLSDAGFVEDTHECDGQVNSSLDSALNHDDDDEKINSCF